MFRGQSQRSHNLAPPVGLFGKECDKAGFDHDEMAQLAKELREAAEAGDEELVNAVIEEGCDVNLSNWYGRTALMAATQHGHLSIAKALVAAGAKINAQNKTGWTALMYSSCNGFRDLVEYLMQANADHQLVDARGRTARQMAKTSDISCLIPEAGTYGGRAGLSALPKSVDEGKEEEEDEQSDGQSSGWGSARAGASEDGADPREGGHGEHFERSANAPEDEEEDEDESETYHETPSDPEAFRASHSDEESSLLRPPQHEANRTRAGSGNSTLGVSPFVSICSPCLLHTFSNCGPVSPAMETCATNCLRGPLQTTRRIPFAWARAAQTPSSDWGEWRGSSR